MGADDNRMRIVADPVGLLPVEL